MAKGRPVKPMFSLSTVDFRDSAIAGRGVFARKRFAPGDRVVAYAPKQRRVPARDPEAVAAAETKLTLLSERHWVIIPDTSVPGGWLCNHSCNPNAAIFSDGAGRIQCTRPIAPGEEVTIFYGWVTHGEILEDKTVEMDDVLRRKLAEYGTFLKSIGQEQVQETIANTLVRIKRRPPGSVVCAF
jgi:SET domain-containing protein